MLVAGCLTLIGWDVVVIAAAAVRVRLPKKPRILETGPQVVVLVPCKGETEHARRFFQHLMAQRYRPFRVILAVESESDGALNFMRLPGMAERAEAVVAPQAQDCSQKVANLIAGLGRLRPEDVILVQADADHLPPPDWLGRLVAPIVAGEAEVVTGYRLMVPERPTLASCWIAAMDNAVATAPRPNIYALCWGGCIAAPVATLERVGYRQGLAGSFNDDCMLSRLLQRAGVPVRSPRDAILHVCADYDLRRLLNFVPRQYLQVRWYAPANRWFCHLLLPLPMLGWGAALIAALSGHWWGLATFALGFVTATAKAFLRWSLVRQVAGEAALPRWRCVFWLTCLAPGFLALAHCVLGYAGLFGRTVFWAGTRYRIDGPKDIEVLERRPGVSA